MQPAGQDLGAPLAPEINGQYRSNGARMPVLSGQCCCSRSATFDRRIAAVESLARDRFDSDCVLGTQFEVLSAPPRILVLTEISRNPAISPELAESPSAGAVRGPLRRMNSEARLGRSRCFLSGVLCVLHLGPRAMAGYGLI